MCNVPIRKIAYMQVIRQHPDDRFYNKYPKSTNFLVRLPLVVAKILGRGVRTSFLDFKRNTDCMYFEVWFEIWVCHGPWFENWGCCRGSWYLNLYLIIEILFIFEKS